MFTSKLKGGALYIAIIICLVIGIILSVFILIAHFNQRQVETNLLDEQLAWNIRSAFEIAQSQGFDESSNNRWFKTGFNNDSIKIKTMQWGAYELIEAQSKNSHHLLCETGLYGTCPTPDTALYIEDSGRPLNFAGAIKFNGGAYLPASGFKSAYIEGASAVIDPSTGAFVRKTTNGMPAVKKSLVDKLNRTLARLMDATDSLGGLSNEIMSQPFSAKTLVIQSGNMNLAGYTLKNNIKIIANHNIIVDEKTVLDNVLLIAANVRIKKGFKGTLQVIARDSIIVEEECYLKYPSSLTLIKDQNEGSNLKGIFIGEASKIEGSLLALNMTDDNAKVIITTKKDCEIYGAIYSSNYANVQGSLYGTMICSRLLLQTPSAVYENHLLNCNIDPKKYRAAMYVPALTEQSKASRCVKKL